MNVNITLTQEELKLVDKALLDGYLAGLEKKDRTESILMLHVANKLKGDDKQITLNEIIEILDK